MPVIPAYTYGGITRPELQTDSAGHIILDPVAAAFAAAYGTKLLYMGVPANTPYPPITNYVSPPVDTNGSTNGIVEGAAAGTAVGITALSTSTIGQPVTYSLIGDSSGGGFAINATTGVVTVANSAKIDFESSSGHSYSIIVQASDGLLTSSQTFTIGVSDVAPSTPVDGNGSINTVVEGAANGTAIGITVAATDVNGAAPAGLTYSLTDDANGAFQIDATTGVVTVLDTSQIDFESSGGSYTVKARASDGALFSTEQTFTINTTNAAPLFPSSNASAPVDEGSSISTVVYQANAADPGGGTVTYSLSGGDSAAFTINSSTGAVTFNAVPDFEAKDTYSFNVVASDGLVSTPQAVAININNVAPSTPVDSEIAANTVVEGAANSTLIGVTADSFDPGAGPAVTYSLIGDTSGGGFAVNATTGEVTVADASKIDFEGSGGTSAVNGSYSITVQASDGAGGTSSQTFTIAVTNLPPANWTDANAGANTIVEGATNGTTIGVSAHAIDPSGGTVTYSLAVNPNDAFAIDASTGVITVADSTKIDFESTAGAGHQYTLTVRGTDASGLSTTNDFVVDVTDVAPDAPTDTDPAATGGGSIAEGTVGGATPTPSNMVGITAHADDLNGGTVTYSLSNDAGGLFDIDPTTGVVFVKTGAVIDYESTAAAGHTYAIAVDASDGTLTSTQNFTIGVTNVAPQQPTDADGAAGGTVQLNAADGTPVGITLAAIDPGAAGGVTYSITDPSGNFVVDPNTGVVTLKAGHPPLTVAATYTITGSAFDGTAQGPTQTFDIFISNNALNIDLDGNDSGGVIGNGYAGTFTEQGAATPVIDADDVISNTGNPGVTDATSATIVLTNAQAGDSLLVNGALPGGITQNTVAGGGQITITLSGTTSYANYEAALHQIRFSTSGDAPNTTPRVLNITVTDSTGTSPVAVSTIAVNAVNDAPTLTLTPVGAVSYTENAAPTALFTGGSVTDPDAATEFSGGSYTVTITNPDPGDQLVLRGGSGFSAIGSSIVLGGNTIGTIHAGTNLGTSNVVIDLTSLATPAVVNQLASAFAFQNTSEDPSTTARIVHFTFNDGNHNGTGGTQNSNVVTQTVNVTAVNDAPVAQNGTASGNEDTPITGTAAATDVDSPSLTYSLVGSNGGAAHGTVTFTNAATGAYTYTPNGNFNGTDTFTYKVNDGGLDSGNATITVTVNAANDAPALAANGSSAPTYTEGGAAAQLLSAGTVADNDNPANFVNGGFTVAIQSPQAGDQIIVLAGSGFTLADIGGGNFELLQNGHTIGTVSFAAGSATVTGLTAFATPAVVNQLVEAFGYQNTLDNFDTTSRQVDFTFNDGGNTGGAAAPSNIVTQTITLTAVNDAPVNHVPGAAQTISAGAANVAISGLSVTDIDGGSGIETTRLTTAHGNLNVTAAGGATISAGANDSHDLTISGTTADITATLATLNYTPDAAFTGSDVLTLTTSDGGNTGGGVLTDIDTVAITVTSAGGVEPTLDLDFDNDHDPGTAFSATFAEGGTGVLVVDTDVTVTETVANSLTSATITLVNHKPNDVLVVNTALLPAGITASAYDDTTGVLTLTSVGTNTALEYQTALQQITFSSPGDDPDSTDRTIAITVNEGATASNTAISTVHVTPSNDLPTLDLDFDAGGTGFAAIYTANGAGVAIADSDVTITDPDDTTLASATVVLTNMQPGDILSINGALPGGITASTVIGATITLTLMGTASLADYQSALQQITFSNSGDTPDTTTARDITVTVNDGFADSLTSHTTITVLAVNHAPVAQNGAASGNEDNPITGTAAATDVDAPGLTYSLVGADGGALHGTVIFTNSATGAYTYTPDPDFFGTDTFTYKASDGSLDSNNATITVTVTPVNDAPVVDLDTSDGSGITGFSTNYTVSATPVAIAPAAISITDIDDSNVASATVTLTNAQTNDVLAVNGALPANINAVITPGSGTITVTLSGPATLAQYQAAIHQIVFSNGNAVPDTTAVDRIIEVVVSDGHGVDPVSNSATTTIHLLPNTPPVANPKTATATEAGGVNNATAGTNGSGNVITDPVADSDAENPVLVVSAVNGSAGGVGNALSGTYGTLTLNADGSYSYAVDNTNAAVQALRLSGQTVSDVFSYTIRDTAGVTAQANLTITVQGVNDNPVAVTDTPTAIEAGTSAGSNPGGNVLTNDTDVDSVGNGETRTVQGVAAGTQAGPLGTGVGGAGVAGNFGTLTIGADGTYSYVVNNANATVQGLRTSAQTLTDTFTYTMRDTAGATSTAQVAVTIRGQNDAPTANADTATATEAGGTNNGTAGTNISNFNVLTGVGTGSVADTDPDTGANGETRTVQGVETGTHLGDVVTSGVGSPLAGSFGTLTLNANGSYSYTVDNSNATVQGLNTGGSVNDVFTYTMRDAAGVTSTTTLNIQVNGANDAPVGAADAAVAYMGKATTPSVNLLTNDTDIDTPPANLTAIKDTNPAHGSVTVNPNGTFTYTGNAGYLGADSFTYHVADNGSPNLSSATVTVTLDVQPLVWHVDNTASAVGADGSAAHPFNSIAAFNAANASAGAAGRPDIVYLHAGTYTEADGFNLLNDQTLLGQGVDLSYVRSDNGQTVTLLDADNTQIPTIVVTAGDGIDLAQNNTIKGLNIGNASGVGIADGNGTVGNLTISGVSINNTIGQAIDIDQGGGTLAVSLGTVTSGAGAQGIQLAGAMTGTFTATGGTLSGHTGSEFDVSGGSATISYGGTIGNGSGLSASIANRTGGSVTLSGNINDSNDAGGGITVSNSTGTIAFTGATKTLNTGAGDAVVLTNNAGATINFGGGGLDIDTTTGKGFSATGAGPAATTGGTVTVTGTGNHLTTGTGTALNITNTTIGAGNVNFQDIASNGAANGIVLNNTGTSGGLIVTGTGSTDGSGGTIQNTTGRGVSLIDTGNVSLSNMNLTNAGTSDLDADNSGLSTGDNLATNAAIHLQNVTTVNLDNINISGGAEQGINGNTVANFTLSNSSITNVGNGPDEDGIHFFNMSGTSAITNTTITGSFDDNLNLQTQSGNLDLTITGGSATNSTQGSGYLFGIRGTTVANINIDGTSSTNNFSGGIVADAFDSATMNLRVNGSTSSGNNDQLSVSAGDNSRVDLEATGNTLSSVAAGDFVVIGLLGSAFDTGYVFDARIHGNTISVANNLTADGIFVFNAGGGVINTAITNNTISYGGSQRAIIIQQGQDGPATTRATITGNNIDIPIDGVSNATRAIEASSGVADPSGAGSFLDLNIGGAGALANTITHSLGGSLGAGGDIRVRQRFGDNVNLDGYVGGPIDTAAVVAYLNARNNEVDSASASFLGGSFSGNASPTFITVSVSAPSVLEDGATNLVYTLTRNGSTASSLVANFAITGTASAATDFTVTGATTFTAGTGLGTVTFAAGSATAIITVDPTPDGDATEFNESVVLDVGNSGTANGGFARGVIADDAPLLAAAGGVQASTPTPGETDLTQTQLDVVVAAAILQWKHAGASPAELAALAAITFTVDDLSGNTVGERTAGHIVIDINAAGHGWFVDSTLSDNVEFAHAANAAGTQLFADPASSAAGHLDLLTAVVHEMGHALGLAHSDEADDVMADTLVDGERRLPDATDLPQVNAAQAQAPLLPVIRGTAGNDSLDAGHGGVILVGEGGADQFVFANVTIGGAAPLTHVADYHFAEGDSFDFSALTSTFHGSGMSDASIVRAVEDASGTFATLQVNTANPAWGTKFGPTWTSVAQIDGAHAGDLIDVLIDNNSIHHAQVHVDLLV